MKNEHQELLKRIEALAWEQLDICMQLQKAGALKGTFHQLPAHVKKTLLRFYPSRETHTTLKQMERGSTQLNSLQNNKDMSKAIKLTQEDFGVSLEELRDKTRKANFGQQPTVTKPQKKTVAEGDELEETKPEDTQPTEQGKKVDDTPDIPPTEETKPEDKASDAENEFAKYLKLTDDEMVNEFGSLKQLKMFGEQELGLNFAKQDRTNTVCDAIRNAIKDA